MNTLDPFTPWRDPPEAVVRRHIGREDLVEAIRKTILAHLDRRRVVHMYLCGPRGTGKSHLLVVAREHTREACAAAGVRVIWMPEETALLGTSDRFLERVARVSDAPRWARWRAEAKAPLPERAVVFVEGLDRQLAAMDVVERRSLRAALEARPGLLVVATGVALSDHLVAREEAFYGAFSPYSVGPLAEAEASALLDHLVGEAIRSLSQWSARRTALIAVAGGSPRTLVSLAAACSEHPERWATEQLEAVVRQFRSHYQHRFFDLPPDGQRLFEVLADAPRDMGPTEIARALEMSNVSTASKTARRMVDDGVLLVREDGRNSWYRIAESLFRYWQENSAAPWESTRAGWLTGLVEALLSPDAIIWAWTEAPDEGLRQAVDEAVRNNPKRLLGALAERLNAPTGRRSLTDRIAALPVPTLLGLASTLDDPRAREAFEPVYQAVKLDPVIAAWRFEHTVLSSPRAARPDLLGALAGQVPDAPDTCWPWVDRYVAAALARAVPQGQPWKLTSEERQLAASIPHLRVTWLHQGKRSTHQPLLDPSDLVASGLPSLHVDFGRMLAAAMGRFDDELFGAVVSRAASIPSAVLVENPWPARSAPALPGALVALLCRSAKRGGLAVHAALGWSLTLAAVTEDEFARALAVISGSQSAPPALKPGVETALLALGLRDRGRFSRLLAVIEAWPTGGDVAFRLRALVEQIDEGRAGRLHPELEALVAIVEAGGA